MRCRFGGVGVRLRGQLARQGSNTIDMVSSSRGLSAVAACGLNDVNVMGAVDGGGVVADGFGSNRIDKVSRPSMVF